MKVFENSDDSDGGKLKRSAISGKVIKKRKKNVDFDALEESRKEYLAQLNS